MIHFTADTHFGHRSSAVRRGFGDGPDSIERMDEELIRRWNGVVGPDDTVYHLGDLSFVGWARTGAILSRLNGQIKLVPGNHDAAVLKHLQRGDAPNVEVLEPLTRIKVSNGDDVERYVLCHFPLLVWDQAHYGAVHLHGHSHGNLQYPKPNARIFDVGVDTPGNQMAPISLTEVRAIMRDRTFQSFDHHTKKHERALD